MNNVKFWQPLSSPTETLAFIGRQIEGMTTRSLFVSDNAMPVRLDDWDETLKAFNVVQSVDMTKPDLTAQQAERGIDIEQLDCFKVRRHQPVDP